MPFETSWADKARLEPLIADGKWHRLSWHVGGKVYTALPIKPGGRDFTVHLYGPQAGRRSGTVWVRLTRVPGNDSTAWCPFPVSMDDPDWAAVLTTFVDVAKGLTGMAVEYKTKVPGLRLKNRVGKVQPKP